MPAAGTTGAACGKLAVAPERRASEHGVDLGPAISQH